MAVANEKWSAHPIFEALDLSAHRRLGHVEPFACPGHPTVVEHGNEGPERFDVEMHTEILTNKP